MILHAVKYWEFSKTHKEQESRVGVSDRLNKQLQPT